MDTATNEYYKDVKHSLSENWSHQREINDEVILLREKVSQLEASKKMQANFIAGLVTSIVLVIFYFGGQSNQMKTNTGEISKNLNRIENLADDFNTYISDVEEKIDSHIKKH